MKLLTLALVVVTYPLWRMLRVADDLGLLSGALQDWFRWLD